MYTLSGWDIIQIFGLGIALGYLITAIYSSE